MTKTEKRQQADIIAHCYTCEEPLRADEDIFYDEDGLGREPFCTDCHEANLQYEADRARGVISRCRFCDAELTSETYEAHFIDGGRGGCVNELPKAKLGEDCAHPDCPVAGCIEPAPTPKPTEQWVCALCGQAYPKVSGELILAHFATHVPETMN